VAGDEHIAAKLARTVLALYFLFAFVAGAVLPFQAGTNAQLSHWLHSPIRASFVSFLVGTIVLFGLSLAVWRPLPSADRLGAVPWWVWMGGLLGAFYVCGTVVTAPKLGAATLISIVVAGQSIASVVVDHFGMVGFGKHEATPGRIVGIALVVAGVTLVRVF
jgi:transporter family-2 protein